MYHWLVLTDDKSALVQVIAWCHQPTSYYMTQCWPRSMSPYGVTRPQWVKQSILHQAMTLGNASIRFWVRLPTNYRLRVYFSWKLVTWHAMLLQFLSRDLGCLMYHTSITVAHYGAIYWDQTKMASLLQTTFSNIFSWQRSFCFDLTVCMFYGMNCMSVGESFNMDK